MKSGLLINTLSHPLFMAKLSPKNTNTFEHKALLFKNNSFLKYRDFEDMWRRGNTAETRSIARI